MSNAGLQKLNACVQVHVRRDARLPQPSRQESDYRSVHACVIRKLYKPQPKAVYQTPFPTKKQDANTCSKAKALETSATDWRNCPPPPSLGRACPSIHLGHHAKQPAPRAFEGEYAPDCPAVSAPALSSLHDGRHAIEVTPNPHVLARHLDTRHARFPASPPHQYTTRQATRPILLRLVPWSTCAHIPALLHQQSSPEECGPGTQRRRQPVRYATTHRARMLRCSSSRPCEA